MPSCNEAALLRGTLKSGRSIIFKRPSCTEAPNLCGVLKADGSYAENTCVCAELILSKKRERSAETHIPLDFQSRTSTCTASKGIFLRQGIPFPRVPIYACSFHTRKPLGFQWKLMGVKVTREFLPRPRLSKRLYWQAENYASAIAKSVCLYGAWAMSFAHESHKAMRISILNIPNLTFF